MNSAERQYRLVQLLGHRFNGINAVAFSPDGKSVAGGGYDALILIWEAATGELLSTLEGHEGGVTGLAFSPDGRWLASGSIDRSVRLWEPASGEPIEVHSRHPAKFESLGFVFISTPIHAKPFGERSIPGSAKSVDRPARPLSSAGRVGGWASGPG